MLDPGATPPGAASPEEASANSLADCRFSISRPTSPVEVLLGG